MKKMTREEFHRFPSSDTGEWTKELCTCVGTPTKVVVCDDYAHNMTVTNGYSDSGMVINQLILVKLHNGDQEQGCATCKTPTKIGEYSHVKICDYCHSFHPIGQVDNCKCVFSDFDDDSRNDHWYEGLNLIQGDSICVSHMKLHDMEAWEDEGVDPEYNDGVWDDEYDFIDGFSPKYIIENSSPDIEWTAEDFRD